MSVELDPVELGFKRPFNHEVSQTLRLHNPHSEPVAFKVKTTAPKQYCVRPNSGRIESGGAVEVQVLLQAMKEDPPPDARCRDKFLVQSVLLPADKEVSNIAATWSQIEQTSKSSIQEKKIRVIFLPADGAPRTNGADHSAAALTSARSPSPDQGTFTPKHSTSQITSTPVGPVTNIESRPEGARSLAEAKDSVHNPATSTGVLGGIVESVSNAVPTSREDLARQLEEAKATITRLTQQSQDQGLRQRKTDAVSKDAKDRLTTGSTSTTTRSGEQSVGGVPVQITAALCLLCFLLAYFFF